MISLLIVSLAAVMVSALIQMKSSSEDTIRQAVMEYSDQYEQSVSSIESCEITCAEESAEP
jgi:hypothetical protein